MTSSALLVPQGQHGGGGTPQPHHNAATLASELQTLHRLQDFYEQHTFDTQGPYADLFAVLLSSCKHVIDINATLVHHIHAQRDRQQRQQVTCDVLCGEVAQHRAEIRELRAAVAHLAASSASTGPDGAVTHTPLRWGEELPPHASRENSVAREPRQLQDRHPHRASVPAAALPLSPPPSSDDRQRSASSSAIALAATEADECSEDAPVDTTPTPPRSPESRTTLLPDGGADYAAAAAAAAALPSLSDSAVGAAWVARVECRLDAVEEHLAALSAAGPAASPSAVVAQQQRQEAWQRAALADLSASAAAWQQRMEGVLDTRIGPLAHRLETTEERVRTQQRWLRWCASPDAELDAPAEVGDEPPAPPVPAPPAPLVRWLEGRLHDWADGWRGVLTDVQSALAGDVFDEGAMAPALPLPTEPAELHRARRAIEQDGGSGISGGTSAHAFAAGRVDLVRAICALCRLHETEQHKRVVAESTRHAARTDDELHDVRARLEVLEVYAPHRYAVTARPPLLGVELEDVREPRVGARLCTVYHGYLADRAGLSVGDVVVGVGLQSIQTRAQLHAVLGELTRDYNAQCRLQMEAGYMRSFTGGGGAGRGLDHHSLDSALQRARAEATAAAGRPPSACAIASAAPTTPCSVAEHRESLAQCLPYCELCLHVVRDGRLRDVTLLVPPTHALRSSMEF
ncbi:hypothetical protein NESM_000749700 [Novymonas esmeraldas]|uniref:PDZ domain-containing protein n=1 Tax=Novymonas esmeraldas TaxID=1808958 RepID=A0AAW0EUM5_9TRYP